MAETTKKSKIKFLGSWIGINLAGWGIGGFSGLCLGEFYLAPIFSLSFDSPIAYSLAPLFVWLPHGAWVGFMQLVILKRWKIQPVLWVIATSLGWGIPATLISWYYENVFVKQFGYGSPYEFWFYGFAIILVSVSVGLTQALVMKNNFAKRWLWILANVLGLVLCVLVLGGTMLVVACFLPSESSIGAREFGFLMWVFLLLTLPFAGIIPSLSTGLYLLKYTYDAPEDKGNSLSNESLLNTQAG